MRARLQAKRIKQHRTNSGSLVGVFVFVLVVAGAVVVLPIVLTPASRRTCAGNCLPKAPVTSAWIWIPPPEGIVLRRRCNCSNFEVIDLDTPLMENARNLSNAYFNGTNSPLEPALSAFAWQWGQFIDHDIMLAETVEPRDDIRVETTAPGDPFPQNGVYHLDVERVVVEEDSDGCPVQRTLTTGFIDGSHIYGNTKNLSLSLRTLDGTGRLRTQIINGEHYMPFQEGSSGTLWLAGDPRSTETVTLSAMHTLFVRNHNHWADVVRQKKPSWSGEEVFLKARQFNVAELQAITYKEYLPALLGVSVPISTSSASVNTDNTALFEEFAGSAYRFGHSQVSPSLNGRPLRDLFFNATLLHETGLEAWLVNLRESQSAKVDLAVVDELRNFLFGSMGMDLVTMNLVRGRQIGLPSAADFFHCFGGASEGLASLPSPPVDLFQGLLGETRATAADILPPTLRAVVLEQFQTLASSDPYFYLRIPDLIGEEYYSTVASATLHKIVVRNTGLRANTFPINAFESVN